MRTKNGFYAARPPILEHTAAEREKKEKKEGERGSGFFRVRQKKFSPACVGKRGWGGRGSKFIGPPARVCSYYTEGGKGRRMSMKDGVISRDCKKGGRGRKVGLTFGVVVDEEKKSLFSSTCLESMHTRVSQLIWKEKDMVQRLYSSQCTEEGENILERLVHCLYIVQNFGKNVGPFRSVQC